MNIKNFFDHMYVINRVSCTERKKRCVKICKELGLEVEFVEAVEATMYTDGPIKASNKALIQSNINCLEDAKAKGFGSVIIFEDDFECIEDALEIFKSNTIPDDWKILLLGQNSLTRPHQISDRIHKVSTACLAQSNGYHEDVYDDYIARLSEMNLQNDMCINDVIRIKKEDNYYKHAAYCFYPSITYQRAGYSDNDECVVGEKRCN